jgi:hypothetical protein
VSLHVVAQASRLWSESQARRLCCKMRRSLFLFFALLAVPGCQPFVLTDASATDKVLATKYWSDLERQYSAPLVCWVVAVKPDAREIHIGTNRANQVVNIRECRVTADGQVWVNDDPALHTEKWVVVK